MSEASNETRKTKPLTFQPVWWAGNLSVWDSMTKQATPPITQQSGMIIHAPNHLGDCVMALPLIQELRRHVGDRLIIVTREEYKDIWGLLDQDIKTLSYPGWTSTALRRLRREISLCGYSTALLLATGMEVAWLYARAGIKYRLGYDYWGRGFLLSARLKSGGRPTAEPLRQKHHALNMLRLLDLTGLPFHPPPATAFTKNIRSSVRGARSSGICGIVIGGNTQDKQFTSKFWKSVIHGLQEHYLIRTIYVFGTSRHVATGEDITEDIPECQNFCGGTTVKELMARLGECDIVLSPDTGTAHLAAILGVPTVSLFTSGSPIWTRPLGPITDTVEAVAPCAPCFNTAPCRNNYHCIGLIDPEDVIRKAVQLIEQVTSSCKPPQLSVMS